MKIYMKLALKVVMSTHINVSLCCSISTAEFLNCCNSWWYWLTTRSWCHGASLSWVQSILKIRSLSMLCEYSYGWLHCIPCRLCVFGWGVEQFCNMDLFRPNLNFDTRSTPTPNSTSKSQLSCKLSIQMNFHYIQSQVSSAYGRNTSLHGLWRHLFGEFGDATPHLIILCLLSRCKICLTLKE
jgi:hypothetical protein